MATDLASVRDRIESSLLLNVVKGRSKGALKGWHARRDQTWRDRMKVVAMDGFTGFTTATTEDQPDTVTVMSSLHIVCPSGNALDH